MLTDCQHAKIVLEKAELLFDQHTIERALDKLATAIEHDLAETNPIVIGVMTGGLVPLAHLLTRLTMPLQTDYLHATRYAGQTHGGRLQWIARPRLTLTDREVLLVDDILDEGETLSAIIQECYRMGAAKVHSAVLFDKELGSEKPVTADYVGLSCPNRYVFGFGMDYKEYWRNIPAIYAVNEND